MRFKELRKVWAGDMYLIVKDGTKTTHVFPSIRPFGIIEKSPRLDEYEVWGIKTDMFEPDGRTASTEVTICKPR